MSPPIRSSGHDKALQAALSTGILQVIITKKMEHLQFLLLKMPDKSTFISYHANFRTLRFTASVLGSYFECVCVCVCVHVFVKN